MAMESTTKGRTASMDCDSGLGSDTDSFETTAVQHQVDHNSPSPLYECPAVERAGTCRQPPDVPLRSPASPIATGYDYEESPVHRFVRERRRSKESRALQNPPDYSVCLKATSTNPGCSSRLRLKTPEVNFIVAVADKIATSPCSNPNQKIKPALQKREMAPRARTSLPEGIDSKNIETHRTSCTPKYRPQTAGSRDEISGQESKAKLFSSQMSISTASKLPDFWIRRASAQHGVESNTLECRGSKAASNSKLTAYRSVETLMANGQNDKTFSKNVDRSLKPNPPPAKAAAKPQPSTSTGRSKNRNVHNLRLTMPTAAHPPPTSPPSTPKPTPNEGRETLPQTGQGRKKYQRARSLDSTPQSSMEFSPSSLPKPDKKNRSNFSALKKFFSLNFRPKSSSSSPVQVVRTEDRCRRRLFSEVHDIKEEAHEMCDTRSMVRFTKNDRSGQAWLEGRPCGLPGVRTVTPTSGLRPFDSGGESAAESMRLVLDAFVRSSKNRIIKQLLQLECIEVRDNSKSVVSEEEFRQRRRELLSVCQLLLTSFRELSLCLFDLKTIRIKVQADYCKNSEPYVQRLSDFLDSATSFVDFLYASWAKYQFKAMAKDVAKDGCNFLDSSHDYVEAPPASSEEAFKALDDRFNGFSGRFEKLLKWTKEIQYCDTVSVLW